MTATFAGATLDLKVPVATRGGPKFLLYSHDTTGLGNIRRTLLIAEALVEAFPDAAVLIVTGSPMIHAFRIRSGIDYIKLPCLDRVRADEYAPRFLPGFPDEVQSTRRDVLRMVAAGFEPDVMIVDKRPTGIDGELVDALEALRERYPKTRIVLGIRDILDDPARTRRALHRSGAWEAIDRYYDEVWIYGSPTVFDTVQQYGFPASARRKTRYCGYLQRPTAPRKPGGDRPRVLVTAGGGSDGGDLIETYLDGLRLGAPAPVVSTVVFGPQMKTQRQDRLRARFGDLPDVVFHDFDAHLEKHYAASDVVVSMAGYNTVCELLSFGLRAVLVPRAMPVREQTIRARRLVELGLFRMVEPDALAPETLMNELGTALRSPPASVDGLEFDGVPRILDRVASLCGVLR